MKTSQAQSATAGLLDALKSSYDAATTAPVQSLAATMWPTAAPEHPEQPPSPSYGLPDLDSLLKPFGAGSQGQASSGLPASTGYDLPDFESLIAPFRSKDTSGVESPPTDSAASSAPAGIASPAGAPSVMPTGGGGAFKDNNERLAFIRQTAAAEGHDPETVATVAMHEGAGAAGSVGDNGRSFGGLQAYTGPEGGQGTEFQRATGLDPSDPNNERALLAWQIHNLTQTGWAPFHGAAAAGIGDRQGIGIGTPSNGRQIAVPSSQAPQSGTPSPMPSSSASPSTYTQQGLADAGDPDAWAKCGPVAAYQFALRTGRNPTPSEVEKLAKDAGWTPQLGMAGFQSEAKVLAGLGIAAKAEDGVDWGKVITDVSRGNPVLLQLPGHEGHYITAQGYDPKTGKIDFGSTVGDLRAAGHKTQFTPTELEGLGWGTPTAALYLDNPATPAPSAVAGPSPAPVAQAQDTTGGPPWSQSSQAGVSSSTPASTSSASPAPTPGRSTALSPSTTNVGSPGEAQSPDLMLRQSLSQPTSGPDTTPSFQADQIPPSAPTDALAPSGGEVGASAGLGSPYPGAEDFQDTQLEAAPASPIPAAQTIPDESGPPPSAPAEPAQPASIVQRIQAAGGAAKAGLTPVLDAGGKVLAWVHDAAEKADEVFNPPATVTDPAQREWIAGTGMNPDDLKPGGLPGALERTVRDAPQNIANLSAAHQAAVDEAARSIVDEARATGQSVSRGEILPAIGHGLMTGLDVANIPFEIGQRDIDAMLPEFVDPATGFSAGTIAANASLPRDAVHIAQSIATNAGRLAAAGVKVTPRVVAALRGGLSVEEILQRAAGAVDRGIGAATAGAERAAAGAPERAMANALPGAGPGSAADDAAWMEAQRAKLGLESVADRTARLAAERESATPKVYGYDDNGALREIQPGDPRYAGKLRQEQARRAQLERTRQRFQSALPDETPPEAPNSIEETVQAIRDRRTDADQRVLEASQASAEDKLAQQAEIKSGMRGRPTNEINTAIKDAGATLTKEEEAARLGFTGQEEVANVLKEGQVIPSQVVAGMIGQFPSYLRGVTDFIVQQRQKLVAGSLTPRDVAKAYVHTVGSMQAGAQGRANLEAKLGRKIGDLFVDQGKVRPEEAIADWLFTPAGKKALDAIENGTMDREAWDDLLKMRDAYGNNTLRNMGVFGPKSRATGLIDHEAPIRRLPDGTPAEYDMHNIGELTDRLNAAKGDTVAIMQAIQRVKGIGAAKPGFIKHLLGLGNEAAFDAVEMNLWLTGKGDTGKMTGPAADMARAAKLYSDNPEVTRLLFDQIRSRFDELRSAGVGSEIDPSVFNHVMHHWIWDSAKGLQTTHAGMYDAMQRAVLPEAQTTARSASEPTRFGPAMNAAALAAPGRTLAAMGPGAVAGGAAGYASSPEGASPEETAARTVLGVGGGALAATGIAGFGTLAAGRLVDSLVERGAINARVLATHPKTADRIRALFSVAADGLPDNHVVPVPDMVQAMVRMRPQIGEKVADLLSGPVTAGDVRRIVGAADAPGIGQTLTEMAVDALTGLQGRTRRGNELAADAATVRGISEEAQRAARPRAASSLPTLDTPNGPARLVDPEASPNLTAFVNGVADDLGVARPGVYLAPSSAVNAAATTDGKAPALILTRGLLDSNLTDSEMAAVLTHELAHTAQDSRSLVGRTFGAVRDALSPGERETAAALPKEDRDEADRLARLAASTRDPAERARLIRQVRELMGVTGEPGIASPAPAPRRPGDGGPATPNPPANPVEMHPLREQGQLPMEGIPRDPLQVGPGMPGEAPRGPEAGIALPEASPLRTSGQLPMEGMPSDPLRQGPSGIAPENGGSLLPTKHFGDTGEVVTHVLQQEQEQARRLSIQAAKPKVGPTLPNMEQHASILERARRAVEPWAQRLSIVRYGGMLSDTASHIINAGGGVANNLLDLAVTPIAAGLDVGRVGVARAVGGPIGRKLGTEREVFFSEVPARLAGQRAGAMIGLQNAAEILRTGLSPADAAKQLERESVGFASGNKGVDFAFEAPLRALAAADAVFRTTAQGGHLAAEAESAAKMANGGKAITPDMLREAMKDPALLEKVGKLSARTVLQEDRMATDWWRSVVNKAPPVIKQGLQVEIPFAKTPYNVVAQGVGLTPLGLAGVLQDMHEGKPARDIEYRVARVALGTAMGAYALADYGAGNLTGPRPTDPKELSTLPPGWQPWSKKVQAGGETYYLPLSALGPLALPPVMAILMQESAKKGNPISLEGAGRIAIGLGQYAAQNTFFQGVSNIGGLFDPRSADTNIERNVRQVVTQFAPYIIGSGGLGRELQRVMGMPLRDPQTAIEALLATNPLTAGQVQPRQDVLGRPSVPNASGPLAAVVRAGHEQDVSVIRAFRTAKEGLPLAPPKQIRDPNEDRLRSLSVPQQKRWQRVFGAALREEWSNQGNPTDGASLRSVEETARTAANETILGMR